jgi:hypothetical protein
MPPKPVGTRALLPAERQARLRRRKAEEAATHRDALRRVATAATVEEARSIATLALLDTRTALNPSPPAA